jgi:hypothetical protein
LDITDKEGVLIFQGKNSRVKKGKEEARGYGLEARG